MTVLDLGLILHWWQDYSLMSTPLSEAGLAQPAFNHFFIVAEIETHEQLVVNVSSQVIIVVENHNNNEGLSPSQNQYWSVLWSLLFLKIMVAQISATFFLSLSLPHHYTLLWLLLLSNTDSYLVKVLKENILMRTLLETVCMAKYHAIWISVKMVKIDSFSCNHII